jgi:hypothetical protein
MKPENEKTFSFKEIAAELGISEDETLFFAYKHGLLNADGTPTEFAIREGLLTIEPPDNVKDLNLN